MDHNLTAKYKSDWALFLPALSSFYIACIGRQIADANHFKSARFPTFLNDIKDLNFLDKSALFHYGQCLYSAGHAELDPTTAKNDDWVIKNRNAEHTFVLGDSGGYQILTGQWPANWRDLNCPHAQKKRQQVLSWLENHCDYGMTLDIPTRIITRPESAAKANVFTYDHSKQATHINNEYWIKNRKGKFKVLCVLHGGNHAQSDDWYNEMKRYCDPKLYPDRYFNGWSTAGVNMRDVEQVLLRLVTIIHDGYLQPNRHDWFHYLGTSRLEYAVLFTMIQQAVRKYHNHKFRISYDCASPFVSAAKGNVYFDNVFPLHDKWSYRMANTISSKKYATDNRKLADAVLQDNIHDAWIDSPVTENLLARELCYRGVNFLNKHGKETKTGWDSFSYLLIQAHNTWMHVNAVIEANTLYERGITPKIMIDDGFNHVEMDHLIDKIFASNDREKSLEIIRDNRKFWERFSKGNLSASNSFNTLFEVH